MAEIQASSQSPIFFRLVEDGDRRCESDLGIPVPKSLVIWGIPTVRDTQNNDPASVDKTGENEVIWEITFAICLIRMLC